MTSSVILLLLEIRIGLNVAIGFREYFSDLLKRILKNRQNCFIIKNGTELKNYLFADAKITSLERQQFHRRLC